MYIIDLELNVWVYLTIKTTAITYFSRFKIQDLKGLLSYAVRNGFHCTMKFLLPE